MKLQHKLFFAISFFSATVAFAGPVVTVTFKNNNTTTNATYSKVTSNEISTYANASPKPSTTVSKLGGTDFYNVQSPLSPDVNYANVRYKIGSKQCVFGTTFVNQIQSGGIKIPKWTKTATASGGAVCTATITSTNLSTYAWTVEFVMK
jgi:hypothetical protein